MNPHNQMMKECRAAATAKGLTFKRQPKQSGKTTLFHFVYRSTHRVVRDDLTMREAHKLIDTFN